MKKILICGGTGLLGSSAKVQLMRRYDVRCHGFSKNSDCKADLTDLIMMNELLDKEMPDIVLNFVALTDVVACETMHQLAYDLNVKIPAGLAVWCKINNKLLVHISTDHIYNKENSSEQDLDLVNNYALTKLAGEYPVLLNGGVILRTNFFGPSLNSSRESFSDWIVKSLTEKKDINLFSDVYFSPLSMITICEMLEVVIETPTSGIYNLGSKNGMSKEVFARTFAESLKLPHEIAKSIKYSEVDKGINRPYDMRMDVSKFEYTYNITLPTLAEEISRVCKDEI